MGSRDRERRRRKKHEAERRRVRLRSRGPEPSSRELAEGIADAGMLAAEGLAEKARQWCQKNGIVPHPQLQNAAALWLAAALQAQASEEQDRQHLTATLETMIRQYEADSGESEVMAAAEQLMQFVDQTPMDDFLPDNLGDDEEAEGEETPIPPPPRHVQEMLEEHGAMLARAAQVYWQRKSVPPAGFRDLQLAAVHILMNSAYEARQNTHAEATQLLEEVRAGIHVGDADSPEYLAAVDQVIDLQLAMLRDRKIGPWIVEQLAGEYDQDDLVDAFVR